MKKIGTILLSFFACFCIMFASACTLNKSKGGFSDEIIVSVDETIDIFNYLTLENVKEKDVVIKFSDSSIVEEKDGEFRAKSSGESYVYAVYRKKTLATTTLVIKSNYSTPVNLRVSDTGLVEWNKVYGIYGGKEYYADYKIRVSYNNAEFEEFDCDTNSYQLNENKKGKYVVSVKALGTKYFDESEYCDSIAFNYLAMEKLTASDLTWENGTNTLSWKEVDDAKYKIKVNGVLYDSENFLDVTTKVLNFTDINAGETIDISIVVYDDSDNEYLETESESIRLTKLGKTTPTYNSTGENKGTISWTSVENISHYAIEFISLTNNEQNNEIIKTSNLSSSFDSLAADVYRVTITAVNDTSTDYFINGDTVTLAENVVKLDTLTLIPYGEIKGEGTVQLEVVLNEDNYLSTIYSVCTNKETNASLYINSDLISAGEEGNEKYLINLNLPTAGVYDVVSYAMPAEDDDGVIKSYVVSGIVAKYVLRSNVSNTQTVYKIGDFVESEYFGYQKIIHFVNANENSTVGFYEIENATMFEVTINEENTYTFNLEEDSNIQLIEGIINLDLGFYIPSAIEPIEEDDNKYYKISVRAYRDDKVTISSIATKTITMLKVTEDGSTNFGSTIFDFNPVENADSYDVYVYKINAEMYKEFKDEGTIDVSSVTPTKVATTSNSIRNLTYGYYLFRIYSKNNLQNDYLNSKEYAEFADYVTENLVAPTIELGYNEDDYSFADNFSGYYLNISKKNIRDEADDGTSNYLIQYLIKVYINNMTEVIEEATIERTGNVVKYKFNTAFDNPDVTYCIEVITTAMNSTEDLILADASILNSSESITVDVKRIATPTIVEVEVEEEILGIDTENYYIEGVSKIYLSNTKETEVFEDKKATYALSTFDGKFDINIKYIGNEQDDVTNIFEVTEGTIYLDSEMETFTFVRSATPIDLKYESGKVSFTHQDNGDIKAYNDFYRIVFIFKDEELNSYEFDIDLNLEGGKLNISAVYAGSNIDNISLEVSEEEFAEILTQEEGLNTIDIQTLINILLERLSVTISESTENIFANSYQQANDFTINLYSYNSSYNDEDELFTISSRLARTFADGDSTNLKIEKMATPTLSFKEEDAENYYFTISFEKEITGTTYEAYLLVDGEENKIDNYSVDVIRVSKTDLEVSKQYFIYARAQHKNYFDSNNSKEIGLYRLSAIKQLTLKDGDATHAKIQYIIPDLNYVSYVDINGTNNGTNLTYEISSDGMYRIKLVGRDYEQDGITYYVADSDTHSINMTKMVGTSQSIAVENNEISFTGLSYSNISYFVIFEYTIDTQTQYHIIELEENTSLNLLTYAENLANNISAGDVNFYIYGTITNTIINLEIDENRNYNDVITAENGTKYYNTVKIGGGSTKKLTSPEIKSIEFITDSSLDDKINAVQTSKVKLTWEGNYGTNSTFEISLNNEVVSPETYVVTNEGTNKYSTIITNDIFESYEYGINILKLKVTNTTAINSTPITAYIYRFTSSTDVTLSDDRILTISSAEVFSDEQEFMIGLTYENIDGTTTSTYFTKKFGTQSGVDFENHTGTFNYDITDEIYSISNGKSGKLQISVILNNLNISNFGHTYYMGALNAFTIDEEINILGTIDTTNIEINSHEISIINGNSGEIYMFSVKGTSAETNNFSLTDVEFDYSAFNYEFTEEWVNGTYEISIYSRQDGFISSIPYVYEFTLQRLNSVQEVLFNRGVNAETSEEEIKVYWALDETASGYYVEVYETTEEVDENDIKFSQFSRLIGNYELDFTELGLTIATLKLTPYYTTINGTGHFTLSYNEIQERCSVELEKGYYLFKIKALGSVNKSGTNYSKINSHVYNFVVFVPENTVNNISVSNTNYRDLTWNGQNGVTYYVEIDGTQHIVSGTSMDATSAVVIDEETLENPGGKVFFVSIKAKGNLTTEKFSTETGIVYMDSESFDSYVYKISGIKAIEETIYDSANNELYVEEENPEGGEGGEIPPEEPPMDPEEPPMDPENPEGGEGEGEERSEPIVESGYVKISLHPNNTEVNLDEIKFYAGLYDTEDEVLKNSIEFTPIKIENAEEFPYVVRLEELISLLSISPTAKGTNELQTIAIWIIYTNEIQANDPNFDTFRSYCLRSNLYEYSFIYEEDKLSTSGDNTLITSLYEYYEWTDSNTNFGNYAEKYFITPIEPEESTNEELIGFWARIKYKEIVTDEEGNTQEVEQVKYTYIAKEDCVDGYIVNKDGKKFFSKKDESGNTDGLITGEAATPSESPIKTLSCYGINLDKVLAGLDDGYYTVSISKYCNVTNGTSKYQKQYDWIGNESFNKLPSVKSVYMSKGIIYWNDDGIDTSNIDYYYLYFYPTEEGLNPKLKILSSSINYFDPSNYILNDRTKYKVAVVAVSKKEKYAPSNKIHVTNSNGVSVEIIKNLIDTTNIIKVDEKGAIHFEWVGTEFYTDINTLLGKSGEEATEHFSNMLKKVYYSPIAFTIDNLIQEKYYNIQFKFEGLDSSQKPYYATVDFAKLLKQEFDIKLLEDYEGLSEDPTGQEKYLGIVKALATGSGVANEKTLFDDFANNVPHGEYKISYRVLGTSSTISSRYCQIVTLENDEEPAEEGNFKYDTYYVVNAPIIKTRLLTSDDGKVYAFMFRQISLPASKGATPTPATSYVIHMGDSYNYYVNLKTGETNKWQCTFDGKSFDVLTCTETGMIDENGDYILVYVNYLTESIVEKFSPFKGVYYLSVFVVGNGYCLGSKSDCISLKLQAFGENFTIVDGQFIWDTHGFDTKVIISRGEENPPEEIVPVDDNGETSTFNLDNYPAGTYEYICFFVEGTRTANSLVVDSEKYYVYNVVKLATPTLSTYKGNIYINDQINSNTIVGAGWQASISKYIYNIYNDASTEEISYDIISNNYTYVYEPGLLDIDEEDEDYAAIAEYKNTEKNAKQFFVRNNGTASATISAIKKIDENGRSYYDFTEESGKYEDKSWTEEKLKEEMEANGGEPPEAWNGLLFSTNANYLIMRSSLATLNAQMAKTITEITVNENGDLTWEPVLTNDNGKELSEENVVYKIIVANKITSSGADGDVIDLAPSSEIEIFYTKLNTFNVTKIKYGNGQGDDDTGEDLFKDFEKNPFLSISIQVLSLPKYESLMIGQYEKIDLVEGGSVIANPVGGNNEGFIYKDSQDFVLLSDRCTNENAKFNRARPIEDDRLEILNKTLYNGNSGELIAEAGDLHWSFMALEMGELLDYYNFIIEVVYNNQITYATGQFLAVPDINKTKELKENEYADADANVKSNLRYFDVYFAFDDGILDGGNTYNINIYAHYKTEDIDPHIRSFGRTITMATKPLEVTANHITISTKAEDNETYEEFSLQNYLARQIGSIGGYNYTIRMYYRFKGEEFISTNFIDFSTNNKTIKITNDINLPDGYDETTRTINITSGQMEYYFYVIPNELSTNILRSDKSETFYLQRPDWGENDKITWDGVTKSFSWNYTGVHSLISETQIYTLDGENLVEVTEEIINDDGEFETVGVKLGLDSLVKLGNPYIATDGTEYIEISIDGDESEDIYYILKSQVSDPTYVITASYYSKNDFSSLIEQRVYQSAMNKFIPEIVGYTSISVTVRLGASNIESVNKNYEIEITETNDDGEEVVVGTERGLVHNNIFTSGEGSELNPYIISNANDFNNIRYRMNKENYLNNYNSITYDEGGNKSITTVSAGTKFYFKQINNISITGVGVYFAQTSFSGDYTAISNSGGTPYRISYTVSDISVLAKDYTWNFGIITSNDGGITNIVYKHGISIFEELAVSANVHDLEVNLSISNQTVNTNVLIAGLAIENKGTVANFALNTMSSLLKTEENSSAVIVYSGVVSYNNTGTLRNVKNKAEMQLTVTQSNTYLFVSGITFMNYNAKIYDSVNEGNISVEFKNGNSTVLVAGLVINNQNGVVNYETAQGTGCVNKGKLTVTSSAKGSTTAYVAGGICWSKALASGTVNVSSTGVIEIGGTVQNKETSDTILRTV